MLVLSLSLLTLPLPLQQSQVETQVLSSPPDLPFHPLAGRCYTHSAAFRSNSLSICSVWCSAAQCRSLFSHPCCLSPAISYLLSVPRCRDHIRAGFYPLEGPHVIEGIPPRRVHRPYTTHQSAAGGGCLGGFCAYPARLDPTVEHLPSHSLALIGEWGQSDLYLIGGPL